MLADKDAMATIAVKDLDVARKFYTGILGLEQVGAEGTEVVMCQSGNSKVLIYQSQYAGANKATVLTWVVGGEVASIVEALKAKGVRFEHYDDLPGLTREGDLHVAGDFKNAWLKDPDGNILSIVSG